eukprot:TRINITY_DN3609_c0_g1_i1.p1 TRINITY_DN3609_c0_g1~~TRINITY_DN3609_c0_g1_i1.p1  ORF type:complete len:115 (+),score=33.71 TRINITY_DN3609_c0_g1_i1:31-345(+)
MERDEQGKNAQTIVCKVCDMKILRPAHGTYVEKEISLPVNADQDEVCTKFWQIGDMFHFENIGFLRSATNQKFLTCAGCERGIIGCQFIDDQSIFLEAEKVKYI